MKKTKEAKEPTKKKRRVVADLLSQIGPENPAQADQAARELLRRAERAARRSS